MRWKLVVAGAALLCALGAVGAVLLVGRGGAAATPAGSTATTGTTSKERVAIIDAPPEYCIEDLDHGKTTLWYWADDEQTLVRGCPGANLP